MVGEHGGAAFVLIYILSTLIVSLPVFIAEVTLGRRSGTGAFGSMSKLKPGHGIWNFFGLLSVIIPTLIASYYSVIGGWSLTYTIKAASMEFVRSDPSQAGSIFGQFISGPWLPTAAHLIFFAICAFIVARGVKSGIERFSKITIPVLFVLILVMMVYSLTLPGAKSGVSYLLNPDFSQIDARSFAYALGQSFYSLSLGMGAIVTYGSYVHKDENIVVSSVGTAVSDLLFAVLAGLAIMPAVFAGGIEPGAGPGLIFQSIPFVFSSFGVNFPVLSTIISVIFFLTIVVAAMTSEISLIEVGVSFLNEKYNVKRPAACLILLLVSGGLGVLCALSFGPLSGVTVADKGIFDMLDWFCSNIMLLLLALAVIIFVGHVLSKEDVRDEVTNGGKVNTRIFNVIWFLIRWVAPIFVTMIFFTNFIL